MQKIKETWCKLKDSNKSEDLHNLAQCYEPINQFVPKSQNNRSGSSKWE